MSAFPPRRLLTAGRPYPGAGRVVTNANVWSPCGEWLVYDTRSDPAGGTFDGTHVERVHIHTGAVETLYTSRNLAHCGVATVHPVTGAALFILGPEHPDLAMTLTHLATALDRQGRRAESEAVHREALAVAADPPK